MSNAGDDLVAMMILPWYIQGKDFPWEKGSVMIKIMLGFWLFVELLGILIGLVGFVVAVILILGGA